MATHWKPNDMPTLTPALPGGKKLIDFVKKVFDVPTYLARADLPIPDRLAFSVLRLIHIVADQIGYSSGARHANSHL